MLHFRKFNLDGGNRVDKNGFVHSKNVEIFQPRVGSKMEKPISWVVNYNSYAELFEPIVESNLNILWVNSTQQLGTVCPL